MRSDIAQRTSGSAACRVSPPVRLFLSSLFKRRGQPILNIFNLDQSNRPQFMGLHHFTSLPNHGMPGVVVSQSENQAGSLDDLGQ